MLQLQFEFKSTNHVSWPINKAVFGVSYRENEEYYKRIPRNFLKYKKE